MVRCPAHFNLMTIIFIKMISVTMIIFHSYTIPTYVLRAKLFFVLYLPLPLSYTLSISCGIYASAFELHYGNSTSLNRVNTIYISSLMHKSVPSIGPFEQQQPEKKKTNILLLFYVGVVFHFDFFFSVGCIFPYYYFLFFFVCLLDFLVFFFATIDMVVVLCLLSFWSVVCKFVACNCPSVC